MRYRRRQTTEIGHRLRFWRVRHGLWGRHVVPKSLIVKLAVDTRAFQEGLEAVVKALAVDDSP